MKAEFIARVMQIMNELGWDDTESNAFIGSDTTKVEGHIESVFVDAWRKLVPVLPKHYFEIKDFSGNKLKPIIHAGIGHIVLPADFYLLVSFMMQGWHKAVETLADSSDSIASIQSNVYTRGNVVRPVCVRNTVKETTRVVGNIITLDIIPVLEYYSLPKGVKHEVAEALYIPLISPLSEQTVIGEKLFAPLAYMCASMVFDIFEKKDIADILEATVIEISI